MFRLSCVKKSSGIISVILGIPLDFIGFYSGIYKLLDMVYTSLNVTGDITANVIINSLTKADVKKE